MNGFLFNFKYFSASGIASITASTLEANILVVMPGYAFCSCMAVLILSFTASRNTGPLTYPPVPTTTSGCISFNIFFASIEDVTALAAAFMFLPIFLSDSLR